MKKDVDDWIILPDSEIADNQEEIDKSLTFRSEYIKNKNGKYVLVKANIINIILLIILPLTLWLQDRAEARHWKEYGKKV